MVTLWYAVQLSEKEWGRPVGRSLRYGWEKPAKKNLILFILPILHDICKTHTHHYITLLIAVTLGEDRQSEEWGNRHVLQETHCLNSTVRCVRVCCAYTVRTNLDMVGCTYLNCMIWWLLTEIHTHKTITSIKIPNCGQFFNY